MSDKTVGFGLAFVVLILTVMGLFVAQGYRKHAGGGPMRWLLGGFIGYGLVFGGLVLAYRSYASGDISFFGGFPAPSAWMVYGVFLFPWVLVILYVRNFDRWIYSSEDAARFQTLVAENQAQPDRRP